MPNKIPAALAASVTAAAFAVLALPLALALALALAAPAQALPAGFTDMTAWENAVANLPYKPGGYALVNEDFEGAPVGELPAGSTDIGLFDMVLANTTLFNSIAFTASTTEVNVDLNDGGGTSGATRIDWINFEVPMWIQGIGFDVSNFDAGDDLILTVNGTAVTFDGAGQDFIGIVDLARITSLTLTADNAFFILDNVKVAIRAVPEPATLALFALGLLGLGAARWHARGRPHEATATKT